MRSHNMNVIFKKVSRYFWRGAFSVVMLASWLCYGHDWPVHMAITESAYQLSAGLNTFVNDENLETQFLLASTPETHGPLSPSEWLAEGSRMEDEQIYGGHTEKRTMDHFYTVTPQRTPGQVMGLTDWSEPSVIGSIFSL